MTILCLYQLHTSPMVSLTTCSLYLHSSGKHVYRARPYCPLYNKLTKANHIGSLVTKWIFLHSSSECAQSVDLTGL